MIAPLRRAWLLSALEAVLARQGAARLVSAPLVFPDARSFPDRWTPDAHGVAAIARRLLGLAGLGHLDVSIATFVEDVAVDRVGLDGKPSSWSHRGAAAWFAGIRGNVCEFGVELSKLSDPLGLVAALAHEVGHAFRHAHRMEHREELTEERLTDLTTVYLGFGVLTTAASERFTSHSHDNLGSSYQRQAQGYLPPEELAFLLAAQLVVRGYAPATIKDVARALPTNQAVALVQIAGTLDRREVCSELGFDAVPAVQPPPEHLPRPWWRRLLGPG